MCTLGNPKQCTDIRVELDNVKLNRNDDPQNLFDKIENIEAKMCQRGFSIAEDEYVAAIIRALPANYEPVLVNAHSTFGSKMSLSNLKLVIIDFYDITITMRKQSARY